MLRAIGGFALLAFAGLLPGQNVLSFAANVPAPVGIPDGTLPFPCFYAAPGSITIEVPVGTGPLHALNIGFEIAHPWYGQLKLTVTCPGGRSADLLSTACNGFGEESDLNGAYVLADGFPVSLDTMATYLPTGVLPPGVYRADLPLAIFDNEVADGTWTLDFFDGTVGDLGTVSAAHLSFTTGCGPSFRISQPTGAGGALELHHRCGPPFGTYFMVGTLSPVPQPGGGWLLGLSISMPEVVAQIAEGAPFFGTLDANGDAFFSIPGGTLPSAWVNVVAAHFPPASPFASYTAPLLTFAIQ